MPDFDDWEGGEDAAKWAANEAAIDYQGSPGHDPETCILCLARRPVVEVAS